MVVPLLSNIYLNPLDHRMSENGYQMVRYADDFVILCRTQAEAEAALADVRTWVEQHGLTLHPEKTHIVDSRVTSFSFLGYSFRGKLRFPRKQSHEKRVDRIREQTPRKSGDSLETIIQRINQSAQGWFNFYRHCHWSIFRKYDEMVRRPSAGFSSSDIVGIPIIASSSSMDQCLLYGMWVVKPERGPHAFRSIHRNLLIGEPYAGEPPVRFGGRGVSNQWDVPTPYVRL